MSSVNEPVHANKRRRVGKKSTAMVEGDKSALDTAMYDTIRTKRGYERVLVPVAVNVDSVPPRTPIVEEVDINANFSDYREPDVNSIEGIPDTPQRNRLHYMKQFAERVDDILEAIQHRDSLPVPNVCTACGVHQGRWRCKDCTQSNLFCRSCMRHSHRINPFHRIQVWTGHFFRNASLWEVGVYLAINHKSSPTPCSAILGQQDMLERLQQRYDEIDNKVHSPVFDSIYNGAEVIADREGDAEHQAEGQDKDTAGMDVLDRLLAGENVDTLLENEYQTDDVDLEADLDDHDAGATGFIGYISHRSDAGSSSASTREPLPPNHDGLQNQYIRVVHSNGIHHIGLLCCSCGGQDSMINDLFFAGMVPASFDRIRTLFTIAVLDQFRYCNLEMKSSAYQFFQLLRRTTQPMNPSNVVNLYHELRRLSRLWRWIKKLKWAGRGQGSDQSAEPKPGSLGIFCPACPQVGVNIDDRWKEDPNRWVYRRVLTADGNFKADHVRQRAPTDDIWLSNGLGMTTNREAYAAFLQKAHEQKTVSLILLPMLPHFTINLEGTMRNELPCNRAGHDIFALMRCNRHCCHCLRSAWLFCTQQYCRPQPRRTAKEC